MGALTNTAEASLLDVFGHTAYVEAAVYCKLHTGDPGETGASNPATETTRKAITFSAASGGTMTTSADLQWTNVAATETYSHVSIWDTVGPAGGNALWYGTITPNKAVNQGDTFTIAAGDLDLTLE